jgi:hypothetical protein
MPAFQIVVRVERDPTHEAISAIEHMHVPGFMIALEPDNQKAASAFAPHEANRLRFLKVPQLLFERPTYPNRRVHRYGCCAFGLDLLSGPTSRPLTAYTVLFGEPWKVRRRDLLLARRRSGWLE